MPTLLRRNLTCFYCGQRSSQRYSRGLRDWQCEKCEAFNFLDEVRPNTFSFISCKQLANKLLQKGQITDPPTPSTPTQVQYAQRIFRHTSPDLEPPSEPLFCATCLKNQHLYTQSLAEYLPPVTDPQYAKYEASYEEYKRNLERRYPQVCAQCEPRARARIQAAGYAAKTDHLRRMMERTRRGSIPKLNDGSGWRWLLVTLGGLAWWSSILLQGAWHVAGATLAQETMGAMTANDDSPSWQTCVQWSTSDLSGRQRCFRQASPLVGWSLVAALASFWWNPKLKDKISGRNARMTGLAEHLWLQAVMIAVRTAAWWMLNDTASSLLPQRAFGGAHAFMIAFLALSTIASLRTVEIDDKPRVLFSDDVGPLIPESGRQDDAFGFSSSNTAKPTSQSQSASYVKPFPVSNLAPIPRSAFGDPPTPPPDDLMSEPGSVADSTTTATTYDADMSMDWSPTVAKPPTFQPRRSELNTRAPLAQQERFAPYAGSSAFGGPSTRDSPFYGTLPPRPQAPAAKLRNPHQPVFQRASDAKKENFFAKMKPLANADPYADSTSTGDRGWIELAQPKWQLHEEQANTGLESMFDTVFSIKDEPAEVRGNAAEARAGRRRDGPNGSSGNGTETWTKLLLWGVPLALAVCLAALKLMGWEWTSLAAFGAHRDHDLAASMPSVVAEQVPEAGATVS